MAEKVMPYYDGIGRVITPETAQKIKNNEIKILKFLLKQKSPYFKLEKIKKELPESHCHSKIIANHFKNIDVFKIRSNSGNKIVYELERESAKKYLRNFEHSK